MTPIRELDLVVLCRDLPDYGLIRGDVGTVVHVHGTNAYEVEFVTDDGATVAVLTLPDSDVRPRGSRQILHVREYADPSG